MGIVYKKQLKGNYTLRDWKEVGVVDENSFNVRVRDAEIDRFLVKATEEEKGDYGKPKLKKATHWRSVDYWFDLDAVREEPKFKEVWSRKGSGGGTPYEQNNPRKRWGLTKHEIATMREGSYTDPLHKKAYDIRGKNPGDFWSINTQPYSGAHFAVFPEKLCEKPILAGCPAEVCKHCGMARVRITKTDYDVLRHSKIQDQPKIKTQIDNGSNPNLSGFKFAVGIAKHETIGWTDCPCLDKNKYEPGIIIDVFGGSGTVGVVAEKLGRSSILIDIKRDYCEMAIKRLKPLVEQTDLSGKQSKITRTNF